MPAERTIHVVDDDAAVRLSLEQLLGSIARILRGSTFGLDPAIVGAEV